MADSIRQKIVDAVNSRLETILTSNGYETDVGNSVHEWRSRGFAEKELPAIAYYDGGEVQEYSHSYQKRTLTIKIHIFASGNDSPKKIRKMMADVEKVIGTDVTWGDLADQTKPIHCDMEVELEDKRVAGALLIYEIFYQTKRFDPYTLG